MSVSLFVFYVPFLSPPFIFPSSLGSYLSVLINLHARSKLDPFLSCSSFISTLETKLPLLVFSLMHSSIRNWTTHHQSYGALSAASLYRAMKRLADGHPDPETGENTAISSAVDVKLHQVYIVHPSETLLASRPGQ